ARKLLAKDGQNAKAWRELSYSLLKQKRFQEAFDSVSKTVALEPRGAKGLALSGLIREELADHPGALRDMDAAARLDGRYSPMLSALKRGEKLYDPDDEAAPAR